ncbi:hypothetical protein B6S59_31600 [Pseudomonas sp. A46]|nr:amidase [Pseudomonas sp. A46]OWJ89187.1 hypothetical protein B6S59_31600 [Pseudomonas sp. A46]
MDFTYLDQDATAQAEAIRRGDVTALELLDAAVARVEASEPAINALSQRYFDEARELVSSGTLPQGPFSGVPFLLKDVFAHMAGKPTTAAARILRDHLAPYDSELTARYRRAGLVIFGKTNVPEMASIGACEPDLFGATHNPFAPDHTAGGSSGGAAAAVAAGYVPMAHASDGAGSIRIPAAHCHLFGLKPSRGRITLGPDIGESAGGVTTEHVVTRSVRDSAALLDATAGGMPGDPYTAPSPRGSFRAALADRRRLRIALITDPALLCSVDPEVTAAAQEAAAVYEALGHEVREMVLPFDRAAFDHAARCFWPMTVTRTVTALAQARGVNPKELMDQLEPLNAALMAQGLTTRAVDYMLSLTCFNQAARALGQMFEEVDLILGPTMTGPAPKLYHYRVGPQSAESAIERMYDSFAFTFLANATGIPAASLPFARTADGRPIGVQLMARYGDEETLLAASAALEAARPWAAAYPFRRPGPL